MFLTDKPIMHQPGLYEARHIFFEEFSKIVQKQVRHNLFISIQDSEFQQYLQDTYGIQYFNDGKDLYHGAFVIVLNKSLFQKPISNASFLGYRFSNIECSVCGCFCKVFEQANDNKKYCLNCYEEYNS